MSLSPPKRLAALLLELETLDRVPRTGYVLRGIADPESVSEHSWHLAFLVWAVGKDVPGLTLERALPMALVHDIAEVRIGDLPRTSLRYWPPGAKREAEAAALGDLLGPLGEEALSLVAEYQNHASAEARFVHACDRLQTLFKVTRYEHWGATGLEDFYSSQGFDDGGFEVLSELFMELCHLRRGPKKTG